MADIVCPHCGFFIPVTGKGSKTVVIVPGRAKTKLPKQKSDRPGLKEVLGDRHDDYWKLASLFGPTKNYQPTVTADLYLQAIKIVDPETIITSAENLVRLTEDRKYLPQLARWLEGQGYLTHVGTRDASNDRISSRRKAE